MFERRQKPRTFYWIELPFIGSEVFFLFWFSFEPFNLNFVCKRVSARSLASNTMHNIFVFVCVCALESNSKSTKLASTFFVLSCKRYLVMILYIYFFLFSAVCFIQFRIPKWFDHLPIIRSHFFWDEIGDFVRFKCLLCALLCVR